MNEDDPSELLNLVPETADDAGRPGRWWLASIVWFLLGIAISALSLLVIPHQESDWFGIRYIAAIAGSLAIGCLLSAISAAISLARGERHCLWSLLPGLPSFTVLVTLVAYLLPPSY